MGTESTEGGSELGKDKRIAAWRSVCSYVGKGRERLWRGTLEKQLAGDGVLGKALGGRHLCMFAS